MELKDVMYCVDNIIDLFMIRSETSVPCYSSASVCHDQSLFSCFAGLQFNHNIAKKIKGINERLDRISKKRDMFNFERRNHPQFRITSVDTRQTSPVEEPGIVGRDIKRATDMMVDIIIENRHRSISSVFGITGMGGIGKTTLAQKIYNEHKIREEFQILIWLCVSQSYSVTGLLKQAITKAGGNCDLLETVAELAPALLDSIRGKSVFLVLDDVWKSDVWINLLRLPFQSSTGAHGVLVTECFKDMSYLKDLGICCTEGINPMHYQATDLGRIQQVYEMLIPSRNLRYLHTNGFPGERFPKWLSSQPQNTIPDLAQLHLHYCLSCLALPPAGQLLALLVLEIKGAYAIASMGAELLGQGVRSAACLTVFPKLNLLQVTEMHNLESWSLNTDNLFNKVSGNPLQIILMPCLQRLLLVDCPKLRALPDDLQKVSSLHRVHIEGVHSLEEITNLPGVVWLMVKNNRKLRRICNLYKLQRLFAQDCPALEQAVCLSSMELLYLVDCLQEECIRRCFLRQPDVLIHVATTGGDGRDVFPDESLYN